MEEQETGGIQMKIAEENPTYHEAYDDHVVMSRFEPGDHRTVYQFENGFGANVINHLWSNGTRLTQVEFGRHGEIIRLEAGNDSIGTIEGIVDKDELSRHLETIEEMEKMK